MISAQRPAALVMARGTSSTPLPGFERPVRKEYPDKVRMGFLPDEW